MLLLDGVVPALRLPRHSPGTCRVAFAVHRRLLGGWFAVGHSVLPEVSVPCVGIKRNGLAEEFSRETLSFSHTYGNAELGTELGEMERMGNDSPVGSP